MQISLSVKTVVLKVVSLTFIFILTAFKESIDSNVFWILMFATLILNISVEVLTLNEKQANSKKQAILNEADTVMQQGQYFLQGGISNQSHELLEQAVILLNDCATKFSIVNSEKFKEVSSWTGIGLACEKLSYINSRFVDIYIKKGEGIERKTEDSSKDRIRIAPTHIEDCIFCTEVVRESYWIEARSAYNRVYTLLAEQSVNDKIKNSALTLVSSARSAGYFFLCDYFRLNEIDSLKKSKYCLQIALKILESGFYEFRENDIQNILKINLLAEKLIDKSYT